jgi:8-oxo-dGTP pyrophosphatase MutT (NUDIX family)
LPLIKTINQLRERLKAPLPGLAAQELMAARVVPMPQVIPDDAKPSAVLCLLFPVGDELHVLLMRRTPDNTAHSGQVSFPGGRVEAGDKNLQATALREAYEEVGVAPDTIEILGALSSLYIPVSRYQVFPFVGYAEENLSYVISRDEVAHVIELPLHHLFAEENKIMTDVKSPAVPMLIRNVKAYRPDEQTIIWGATAMILSELEVLLKEL